MRTFHIGGAASAEAKDPEFKLPMDTTITALPNNLIRNEAGQLVIARRGFMSVASVYLHLDLEKVKSVKVKDGERVKVGDVLALDKDGNEILAKKVGFIMMNKKSGDLLHVASSYQLPLDVGGAFQKDIGEYIKKNEVIYKFDPINEPIIAEVAGTVRYDDIFINKTLKEEVDEYTGVMNKRITETKEEKLQPKLIIVPDRGDAVTADLPANTVLYVEDGQKVKVGTVLAGKIRTSQKTSDITGGLPRVQELFEARNPSNAAVIAGIDGIIEIGETVKGKRQVQIRNEFGDIVKHVVPSGKALVVRNGDTVKCGEPICEGDMNPHDILKVTGEIALYEFVLKNVQEVYKRQGVNINDKHIGVIIRQMLRKVEIVDPGDTSYIRGELVDRYRLREENKAVAEEGGQPAVSTPVLLGLTKASLNTESFISSASFQETTKVLTNSAIKNSSDELRGLKENVIIGHKIPAGTGKKFYQNVTVFKHEAGDLDFLGNESEEHIEKILETSMEEPAEVG
jgi:DNA-directed RNA polymerase subunit beta'